MVVKQIHNKQEWDALVAEGKPVLVDFFAVWCGPCRVISPVFEKLSDDASFAGLNFAKIDVDENPELSQEFGITAMPTFILVKNGIKEGEVRGANPPALQALVQRGAA